MTIVLLPVPIGVIKAQEAATVTAITITLGLQFKPPATAIAIGYKSAALAVLDITCVIPAAAIKIKAVNITGLAVSPPS